MTVTIYHNPRCSKSRQTLQLLESRGIEPRIVEYLKTPPSVAELKSILKKLGLKPLGILRVCEPCLAELGVNVENMDDDALIALMAGNPILIERPIVVNGEKAANHGAGRSRDCDHLRARWRGQVVWRVHQADRRDFCSHSSGALSKFRFISALKAQ